MDSLSQTTKVLRAIKESGNHGVENWKLSRIALCYSKRIQELREEGYNITAERQTLKNGRPSNTWKYYLNGKKDPNVSTWKKAKPNPVIQELMIAKSKGRFGSYKYICDRLTELGV